MATQPNQQQSDGRHFQTAKELKPHPAALLFPMMSDDELNKLADDIAANGLLEPVIIFQDQILDGRNRLAACTLADVVPDFVEVSETAVPSPSLYVLSRNLHRRHLTIGQRSAIAVDVIPMLQEEAKKRQGGSGRFGSGPNGQEPEETGSARSLAAKALGVGEGSVQRVREVKHADPVVFERVRSGELSPAQARKIVKVDPKPETPYEPKTDHQKKLAEGQKERMIRALSTITGLCRGLGEMDVRKAVAACYEEERAEWVERAKDLSSQLRAFAGKLQKGF